MLRHRFAARFGRIPATAMLLLCSVAVAASSQLPPPKPKPKAPAKASSQPRPPGTLVIEVDEQATVAVDGRVIGRVQPGEPRSVAVTLGRHALRVTSLRTGVSWQEVVEVKDTAQEVVRVRIRDSVEQQVWLDQQRAQAAGHAESGEKTVLLVVDAALRSLVREHAAALASVRIRPGPGIPGTAEGGLISDAHAALKLDPPRPGGEIEVAGTKMRNCTATVHLSLTRGDATSRWPIDGVGAGISDTSACAEATRRAVSSALSTLASVLRREGR